MALDAREFREHDGENDTGSSFESAEHAHIANGRSMTRRDALRWIGGTAAALGFANRLPANELNQRQETIDRLENNLRAKGWHFPEQYEAQREGNGLFYPSPKMPERRWMVEPVCFSAVYDYDFKSPGTVQFVFPMLRNIGEQRNLGAHLEIYVGKRKFDFPQGIVRTEPFDNAFLATVLEGIQGKGSIGIKHLTYVMNADSPASADSRDDAFYDAIHGRLSSGRVFPHTPPELLNMEGEKAKAPTVDSVSAYMQKAEERLTYKKSPSLQRILPNIIAHSRHVDAAGYAAYVSQSGATYADGFKAKDGKSHSFNYVAAPDVGGFLADPQEGRTMFQDRSMFISAIGGLHYKRYERQKILREFGIPGLEVHGKQVGEGIEPKFGDFTVRNGMVQDTKFNQRLSLREESAVFSTHDNNTAFSEEMRHLKEKIDPDTYELFRKMEEARLSLYLNLEEKLAAQ